jgi:hydroxymethylpyrimidine kinase / phosphomethylpyrimidine kinase / thiamine-phosphate diphosphorylase
MTVALTIAGSDTIGGAGIQADLKAFAAMGVHDTSVITSVTSQNTVRVKSIFPLPPGQVISQLEAILEDVRVGATKTGMLHSPDIAKAVGRRLAQETFPIVVDPLMVAGVGDRLDACGLAHSLKTDLLPIASLVMPNRHEAEILTDMEIHSLKDAEEACRTIMGMGSKAVLIKGGHFTGESATDLLLSDGVFVEVSSPRLDVRPHGAGCTYSAFITAHLALGLALKEAVIASKSRIADALAAHYAPGMGQMILDQLATLRREAERYPLMSELSRSVGGLESFLEPRWIPQGGLQFAASLQNPRGFHDLVSIESQPTATGMPSGNKGCLAYGADQPAAHVLLAASRADPNVRTVIGLKFTGQNLEALTSSGLSAEPLKGDTAISICSPFDKMAKDAISRFGNVPDVFLYHGDTERRPTIWVMGANPMNVLMKMRRAIS